MISPALIILQNQTHLSVKKVFYIVILLAIITGISFPQLNFLKNTLPFLIGLILYFNFLEIKVDLKQLIRKEYFVTLPLSAIIIPFIVFYILSVNLPIEYRTGLFFIAIAPNGIMVLLIGKFVSGRDYDLMLGNFLVTSLGFVLYLPVISNFILGNSLPIDPIQLFIKVAGLVFIPYGLKIITEKYFSEKTISAISNNSNKIVPFILYYVVSIAISNASGNLNFDYTIVQLIIIIFSIHFIHGGIGYIAGTLFDNSKHNIKRTLAFLGSSRNNQIMLGLSVIYFSPMTTIVLVLGIILHHITNLIWLWIFRK